MTVAEEWPPSLTCNQHWAVAAVDDERITMRRMTFGQKPGGWLTAVPLYHDFAVDFMEVE